MRLTVKEAAKLLEVSEKTIYRWINNRNLPSYRLSGQYRFNRAEVLEWATANKVNVSFDALKEDSNQPLPSLSEALQAGGIFYRLEGADKVSALRGVVDLLRLPEEVDREFLFQVLLAREQMASTAVGDGIAIPHTRNPIVMHVEKPQITLCFLEKPVDFNALDGKPVYALFTLVCPTVRSHLHLLSRLAFALRNGHFMGLIRSEASREDFFLAIEKLSQSMEKTATEIEMAEQNSE